MSKILALFMILSWASLATAGVINMEFKFTPYVGDPSTSDQVETVAGKARVFINNVPFAEQEVRADKVPVLFSEREIGASVWVPAGSLGAALRKGRNTIRFEFEPGDMKKNYHGRLAWTSVTDQTTERTDGNRFTATNQSGQGQEDRLLTGTCLLQREFVADFAADLGWHHYPPVTALSDGDKQALALLVKTRAAAFRPDFSDVYRVLEKTGTSTWES